MEYDILNSVNLTDLSNFKSFTDRYFSKRYILNVDGVENNDIMLMFHSNRITLLSLAPSHFFFKKNECYKVNFNVGSIDRLSNSVKGKGKKGGQMLIPKSVICKIEYDDGNSFDIPCCMKGTLIEVNGELLDYPELLRKNPDSSGFIAIILSSIAISDSTKSELLTHEEYVETLNGSLEKMDNKLKK